MVKRSYDRSLFHSLLTLLCLAVAPGVASAQEHPPADTIIDGFVEAIGGAEAISKIENSSKTGEIAFTNGAIADVAILQKSGKYSMEVFLGGGQIRRGSDGTVVWEIHPQAGPQLIQGNLKATFDENYSQPFPVMGWSKDKYTGKISCEGVEEIDGRPCYRLVFEPKEGYKATRYFDKETSLLTKLETTQEFAQLGEVAVSAVFSDYKAEAGVSMPMTQVFFIDGEETYTTRYTTVKYNVEIDDEKFSIPAEIKALLSDDG